MTSKFLPSIKVGNLIISPKCKSCNSHFSGNCFSCDSCNFVLCPDCHKFQTLPVAGHPILRCQSAHLLRWAPSSKFICDLCCVEKDEERYRCKRCNYDICAQCSEILVDIIIQNTNKTHGQANHPLKWNPVPSLSNNGNPVTCGICKIPYKRAGMFSCVTCDSHYCLQCYNDPNRPKPQVRNYNSLAQDLIAVQLLASLLRSN